jgi:hypothetical protein
MTEKWVNIAELLYEICQMLKYIGSVDGKHH